MSPMDRQWSWRQWMVSEGMGGEGKGGETEAELVVSEVEVCGSVEYGVWWGKVREVCTYVRT